MRVAMLSFHSCPEAPLGQRDAGGMNVYVLNLARGLSRLGVQVDVFSRRHSPDDPTIVTLDSHATLVHIDAGPHATPKHELEPYLPAFLGGVVGFAEAEGRTYDLVHSHYWLSGQAGAELARLWAVPHVTNFHTLADVKRMARAGEWEPAARSAAEERLATSVDAVVVSDPHESNLLTRLYGSDPARTHVIPGGVDLDRFRPIERPVARHELNLNGEPVLLFVGRLDPLKGIDLLLQGAALLEDSKDVQIMIVGGDLEHDVEASRLAGMAAELGLAERVRFEGSVPQERLPVYYSAADVAVAPSYYESFGFSALEAMACGTPVVAARAGGLRSLVRDGETGYLVPWHCPEPFAQRMEVLLSHPDLRERMGLAGLERAQDMDWGTTARAMVALYENLTNERADDPAGPLR